MYEAYWELSEPPFDNSPNPKFFYLSPEHEEALVRLVYTVRHRKGCGMLTGEYGCGKTTLSRALIQRLEAERYEIGLLTNPSWNAVDFLRGALSARRRDGGEAQTRASPSPERHLLPELPGRTRQRGDRGRGAADRGRRGFRGAPAAAELPDGQPVPRDAPAHRLTGARGQGAAHESPRPADHAPLPPQHPRLHAHGELHRPPAEDGGADEAALHRGSGQAHLRLHARHAPGDQQPLRRGAPRRVLEAGEGGRREDHRRGDQGHGGRLTMVRMSDLARGGSAEKAAPPKPAPPKEP